MVVLDVVKELEEITDAMMGAPLEQEDLLFIGAVDMVIEKLNEIAADKGTVH